MQLEAYVFNIYIAQQIFSGTQQHCDLLHHANKYEMYDEFHTVGRPTVTLPLNCLVQYKQTGSVQSVSSESSV
jgi:hypothetical protein